MPDEMEACSIRLSLFDDRGSHQGSSAIAAAQPAMLVWQAEGDGYKSDDDNFGNGRDGAKKANEKDPSSENETCAGQSVRSTTGR